MSDEDHEELFRRSLMPGSLAGAIIPAMVALAFVRVVAGATVLALARSQRLAPWFLLAGTLLIGGLWSLGRLRIPWPAAGCGDPARTQPSCRGFGRGDGLALSGALCLQALAVPRLGRLDRPGRLGRRC